MESGSISPAPHHTIDIQQHDDGNAHSAPLSMNMRRDQRPRTLGGRSIDRQVSLETGFAVMQAKAKKESAKASGSNSKERKALPRSGKSLGGIRFLEDPAAATGGGVARNNNKGDFSMFRTKSTLVKQMSMKPMRKESKDDQGDHDELGGEDGGRRGAADEGGDENVPAAGRFFAALRGPELDQVKVSMAADCIHCLRVYIAKLSLLRLILVWNYRILFIYLFMIMS